MSEPEQPLRPATETNLILGQLLAKVDAVATEQTASRTEVSALRTEVADVKADVAVLKSQQKPGVSWWQAVSGFAGVGALITVIVQLFQK